MRTRGSPTKRVIGLRAATLLTSTALVALLVAGLWFFLHSLIHTQMHTLEVDAVRQRAETAHQLIVVAQESKLASARDWGMWGDT